MGESARRRGRRARRKGIEWERTVASSIREVLGERRWWEVQRRLGQARDGGVDVEARWSEGTVPRILLVECKRGQRIRIQEALRQLHRAASEERRARPQPAIYEILAVRWDRERPVAVIPWWWLLELIDAWAERIELAEASREEGE